MNKNVLKQLQDLAKALNKADLKPVICGGLGIYLRFSNRQADFELRATTDIDLMVTSSQAQKQANRESILRAIKDDLKYTACEEMQYTKFEKEPNAKLDILAPSIKDFNMGSNRVRLVKSQLHGHITPEACFVEEELETISLDDCSVQVPSSPNLLIMKLFAFDDRYKRNNKERGDIERAQAHAFDIFVIAELSTRDDYLQAKDFFLRHKDSEIIISSHTITKESFGTADSSGWGYVLKSNTFYPNLNPKQKRQKLEHCSKRLMRWFED